MARWRCRSFVETVFLGSIMGRRPSAHQLGARERQILDAVFHLGEASVSEVRERLPDPPSYSAVRTMIRLLESKGYLKHRAEGAKYIYRPTQSRDTASRSALLHVLKTFHLLRGTLILPREAGRYAYYEPYRGARKHPSETG